MVSSVVKCEDLSCTSWCTEYYPSSLCFDREMLEKYAHIITLISMDFLDAALNQMTGTSCYKTLESVMSTVAASITTLYKAAQGDSAQPESKDLLNVVEQMFNIATEKIACWLQKNLPYSLLSIYTNTLRDDLELEVCSNYNCDILM